MTPTTEPTSLEQFLADQRDEAAVLRRNGHAHDAELLERVCDGVTRFAEEYLVWLSEGDAQLRSGKSLAWLRARFPAWERAGHARREGRTRRYRMMVIPQRANAAAAYAAGRQGAA